jgi:para-aminobenzoate synthetase/4-amino-4-deoxychorismate lyase
MVACSMPFSLLETMRLQGGTVVRLERHLARMAASAAYFGFRWNEPAVRDAIAATVGAHPAGTWRLRLLVSRDGAPLVECTPHLAGEPRAWRVAFAGMPVDEDDPFLRHKTTNRATYELAKRARPDVDDVLLWNGREEVTEATIANVVAEIDGVRYTPPVSCGLLPGALRAQLIEEGAIREHLLTKADVAGASRLWLINSVREWIEAALI